MTTYIINSLYNFKNLHATHPQIHLKTRKMSTHVYSSYVNILDLHIGHVGGEVQKIFH